MQVKIDWGTMSAVELTADGQTTGQDFGVTYVIDQNGSPVPATNQGSLTKYAIGTLTINNLASNIKKYNGSSYVATTMDDRALLHNVSFDVYVTGDGQ